MALIGPMKYLTIGGSTYEIQGQEITSSAITSALGYTPYNGSTNPNGYITASDVPEEIFIATYGTTTYNEVLTAYNAGKTIICENNSGRRALLGNFQSSTFYFYYNAMTSAYNYSLNSEGWHTGSLDLVTTGRKINNKNLSSDITLTASDVGALSDSTVIPTKTSDLTNDSGYVTTDTKNTAGATTTGSTLYLIGTTQQTANPQTYTVGVNSNHLYFATGLKSQAYYSDNKSYISQNSGSIYLSVEDEDYSAVNLDMVRGTIVLSNRGTYDLDLENDNYILFDGQENEIRIRGLVTPTNDNDAATKEYVDDHSSDTRVSTAAVISGTTYYPTVGSNTTSAATKYYDSTGFTYKATRGAANGTDGEATITLGNSTASTAANWKQGKVVLYGTTAYATTLLAGAPSAARTITFPNATGTVALTSNIPDVSGKIDTAGTGLSKSGTTLNHSNSVTAQTTQAVYPIKIDAQGHISAYGSAVTIPSDTKNTAGSTDTSSKIFLIGATSQAANPQTYSHDTAYVGTDGKLYSAGKVVLTGGSNAASSVSITPSTTAVYSMTSAGSVTAGTAASFTRGTFSQGTLPAMTWAMDSTDTKKLNITFSQGTLPTHAADSFTANTPTAVTLPGRSSVINAWTGYSAATAAAQTFTGTTG